jgi:L-tyrosine isonitrile synthase
MTHAGTPSGKVALGLTSSNGSHLVANVLRAFNTWSYKREQPSDPALLEMMVTRATAREAPIPFVLYWGKGPRHSLADPDVQCLDFLASMGRRIGDVYAPGACFTLLLTDSHALLNQHPANAIHSYFEAIEAECAERQFEYRWLSRVTQSVGPHQKTLPETGAPDDVMKELTQSAAKWYGGTEAPSRAAARYFQLNMLEKHAVAQEYPDSIFITFNNRRHRLLFPDNLPVFYMYSLKKGVAVKPWFYAAQEARDPVQLPEDRMLDAPSSRSGVCVAKQP